MIKGGGFLHPADGDGTECGGAVAVDVDVPIRAWRRWGSAVGVVDRETADLELVGAPEEAFLACGDGRGVAQRDVQHRLPLCIAVVGCGAEDLPCEGYSLAIGHLCDVAGVHTVVCSLRWHGVWIRRSCEWFGEVDMGEVRDPGGVDFERVGGGAVECGAHAEAVGGA